jgi:hypothetical protein
VLDFSFFAIVFPIALHGFPSTAGSASEGCWGEQWEVSGVFLFPIWLVFEFILRGVRAQRPFCLSAIVAFYT